MHDHRPPERLLRRVGWGSGGPHDSLDQRGIEQWRLIRSLASDSFGIRGKRVLDFGCGVGHILREAVAANPEGEYWGCDNHAPSVEWLRREVGDQAHVFLNHDWPPLPTPAEHFDVVFAFSVFTHLTDSWSAWLLELHRVLADDGVLVATVLGPGQTRYASEPISEDTIGMNVICPSASWDRGGPVVLHSEWWLRGHWGRAFEILELRHGEPSGPPPLFGQAILVMRKRPTGPTIRQLEEPEQSESRELAAARQNIASLRRELAAMFGSKSWRVTAPLRTTSRLAQELRERTRR